MSDLRKVIVNETEVEVPGNFTVLQACEEAGIDIPRFCYHERLSIAGNCRMCLVEVVGGPPKPQASCALGVSDLRPGPEGEPPAVKTNTPMVKKAREGVMEFLLINHPLDCPICDQGGECDLQDQAMAFGADKSRYELNKRAVEEKEMGLLVKTVMTRCIQCTRCVRFATEVAGVPEIGATGRGETMEIATYLESALTSELSGNVIDLCPVGALTSKPYAFTARPWELRKTETVDVMDAVGSNIRVDVRGRGVMRIMPVLNEDVNEEWISDKTRFIWDGLGRQRLDRPYLRENGKLRPASWDDALAVAAAKLKITERDRIGALAGDLCDVESLYALRALMNWIGSPHMDCRQDGAALDATDRSSYLFNSTLAGVEDADAILLVGTNPRLEAPVLNARIRKAWLAGNLPIGVIGEGVDLTYDYDHLGAGPETLAEVVSGRHSFFDVLKNAGRPMVIVGQGALARVDGDNVRRTVMKLTEELGVTNAEWNGFNVLHTAAGRVGGLDVGFVPGVGGKSTAGIVKAAGSGDMDVVWLMGADEIEAGALGNAFVIYQGSHGDAGAHQADVILPGAAFTEKDASYLNTEGRLQRAYRCVPPPGEAKEDWAIVRALSGAMGKVLNFDSLTQLRGVIAQNHPALADAGVTPAAWQGAGSPGPMEAAPFANVIGDYYLTNPVARASLVMAECSALKTGRNEEAA